MLRSPQWALRLSRTAQTQVRTKVTRAVPKGPRNSVPRPPLPTPKRISPRGQTPQDRPQGQSQELSQEQAGHEPTKVEAVSNALHEAAESGENSLLTPVYIPDDPHGIIKDTHPAMSILNNSSIVVQRQLEMMNVLMGFEQANRYVIMDPQGNHIGYLAEQDHGLGTAVKRQAFRTRRSFTTHVFDKHEKEVLRIHRPFAWINSRIRVYDAINLDPSVTPSSSTALQGLSASSAVGQSQAQISTLATSDMRIIGEAHQQWAPLRRKYNLFLHRNAADLPQEDDAPRITSGDLPLSNSTALQTVDAQHPNGVMVQWAYCDEPFLSWDFSLKSDDGQLIGSVNRNFAGFGREIFTDTGVYALRMDSAGLAEEPKHLISKTGQSEHVLHTGMTLDQRAVMLATAVSIDFDYFSRHSSGVGGGFMPLWFPWWGGGAAEAGAEAGAVGVAGAESGIAGEVAGAARGVGAGVGTEGAIAGAGTMAGYEAMQHARGGKPPDNSPVAPDDASPQSSSPWADEPPQTPQQGEDSWPWSGGDEGPSSPGGSGGGSGGGDGGSWFDEFF